MRERGYSRHLGNRESQPRSGAELWKQTGPERWDKYDMGREEVHEKETIGTKELKMGIVRFVLQVWSKRGAQSGAATKAIGAHTGVRPGKVRFVVDERGGMGMAAHREVGCRKRKGVWEWLPRAKRQRDIGTSERVLCMHVLFKTASRRLCRAAAASESGAG